MDHLLSKETACGNAVSEVYVMRPKVGTAVFPVFRKPPVPTGLGRPTTQLFVKRRTQCATIDPVSWETPGETRHEQNQMNLRFLITETAPPPRTGRDAQG